MRAEHWDDFGTWGRQPVLSGHFFASIPDAVLQYFPNPHCQLIRTLSNPQDVVPAPSCSQGCRRLQKISVMTAAGPLQHGVVCRMEPAR